MNQGMVIGVVTDSVSGDGIANVSVTLGQVRFSDEARGVRIQSASGGNQVQDTTGESGFFQLGFSFDPLHLGNAVGGLRYRVLAQALVPDGRNLAARNIGTANGRMVEVISLRQVADGGIPRPTTPGGAGNTILSIARRVQEMRRTIRTPQTPAPRPQGTQPRGARGYGMLTMPSAEMVQFFGAVQMQVERPAGMRRWTSAEGAGEERPAPAPGAVFDHWPGYQRDDFYT